MLRRGFTQTRWASTDNLLKTCLYDSHKEQGCKFVDFAGYAMPVQYTGLGLVKEHKACRQSAALFDVSHMGQWRVHGADRKRFLEHVTVYDFEATPSSTGALTVFTNERGGIIDDTIIVNTPGDATYMVVNAGCQVKDYDHCEKVRAGFDGDVEIERLQRGLVALQGPRAAGVLAALGVDVSDMTFMQHKHVDFLGEAMLVTRCGYTGEDGFEISCSEGKAAELWAALCAREEVTPAGLGARDTLRIEAGLCLYGNDMTEDTTPIEANLNWLISQRRRAGADFIGAERVLTHLNAKPKEEGAFKQRRVCMVVSGPPARAGAIVKNADGKNVGVVCSGTFSPSLGKNLAMAYVNRNLQKAGTQLQVEVRGKVNPAEVVKAPFVPHQYVR